jgi:hypothetical protein
MSHAPASTSTGTPLPARPSLKARLLAETKSYLMIAAYLWVFLITLTTYRALVQQEYNVGYFQYGFSLVEALILAKLIIIGRVMNIGERFRDRPLIVTTLYKTLCFGLLVVVVSILEHVAAGLWHGEGASDIAQRVVSRGKWEILCRVVMMIMVFLPMFATWEIGRFVGEGKLFNLFFRSRTATSAAGTGRGDTLSS